MHTTQGVVASWLQNNEDLNDSEVTEEPGSVEGSPERALQQQHYNQYISQPHLLQHQSLINIKYPQLQEGPRHRSLIDLQRHNLENFHPGDEYSACNSYPEEFACNGQAAHINSNYYESPEIGASGAGILASGGRGGNHWAGEPVYQTPSEPPPYGAPPGALVASSPAAGAGTVPLGKEWTLLSRALVTNASTMGCCSKKKLLMVATSFCACASFAFLCIAVATDHWLYALERIKESNGSTTIMYTHTGLWRKCIAIDKYSRTPGGGPMNCSYVRYFEEVETEGLGPTEQILYTMKRATVFPLISIFVLLVGQIACFLGHCNHKRKVLTFVAGIIFVVGGLVTLIGIILFVGAISEEVGGKMSSGMDDPKIECVYGSSFVLCVGSFLTSEMTGVFSVYLYITRHKHAYRKKQQERLTMLDTNPERPHHSRYRRSQSCDRSQDCSPSHSETYYTYTPVSETTSKDMSNYTLNMNRDPSRHTISTTADTHLVKDHSLHSVREMDTFRRTTPV